MIGPVRRPGLRSAVIRADTTALPVEPLLASDVVTSCFVTLTLVLHPGDKSGGSIVVFEFQGYLIRIGALTLYYEPGAS